MEHLKINERVIIVRSNGNYQQCRIIKLDAGAEDLVTVEWMENYMRSSKEMPLEELLLTNHKMAKLVHPGQPCPSRDLTAHKRYPSVERGKCE
nr:kinesin-like protein Klp59C [Drosophila bipectinata]